jgi:hypothetical protein
MDLEKLYVESLDEKSRIAYNIAKSHLGTLFSLVKSNHYIEWREGRGECLPSCSPAIVGPGRKLVEPVGLPSSIVTSDS